MRNRWVVVLVAACLLLGSGALAQDKPYLIHASLGYCKVLNDNAPDGSVGLGLGLIYRLENPPQVGIGGEIGYYMLGSYSYSESNVYGDYATAKATWSTVPIQAQIYYFVDRPGAAPVLSAGLGIYPIKTKVEAEASVYGYTGSLSGSDTETNFGINFGGGMKFGQAKSSMQFGIDGRFHLIMTDVESTNLITIMGRLFF